ncbi:MAG: hypothetical protein WCK26_00290 [Candidatus Saccharibacteria bacterium]
MSIENQNQSKAEGEDVLEVNQLHPTTHQEIIDSSRKIIKDTKKMTEDGKVANEQRMTMINKTLNLINDYNSADHKKEDS